MNIATTSIESVPISSISNSERINLMTLSQLCVRLARIKSFGTNKFDH